MTAATFEDATTLEGAPRPLVEDAWVALNKRYAIGAAVLAATLALLWALGMGPGATGSAEAPAGTAQRAADVPGAARPATGTTSPAASPADARSASASGAPASAVGGSPAASSGASTGAAAATSTTRAPSAGTDGAASAGGGAATAALPRPVAGAPVARLYFEPDQAWPSGEVGPRLAPVLARLKAEPDAKALVSGFHDRRGSLEANTALAKRRAETVRRILIREGVAADRIVLAKPQQTTGSGDNREARRVEVTVAR
jgi:outer membrane protein OmpA-like peptidoglycan-associated protein